MTEQDLYKLRFPIGAFQMPDQLTTQQLNEWINTLRLFPEKLKYVIKGIGKKELNWKYRPNGWTIKQVIHHCTDSHMNSFIRFKLALTEDKPKIRPYFEDRWAELPDSLNDDVTDSIELITSLHKKWVYLLNSLNEEQLKREFIHPEHGKVYVLSEVIGFYAWHCTHHLTHIRLAIDFQGKFN